MKLPSPKNLILALTTLVTLTHCGKATNFPMQEAATEESTSARVATYLATASSSCSVKATDPRYIQLVDVDYYLRRNGDVANAYRSLSGASKNAEVVKHFVCNGHLEGRKPNLLYDEAAYLEAHPDVKDSVRKGIFKSGFDHLALSGQFEMATGSRKSVVSIHVPLYNMIPEVPNRNTSGPPVQMFDSKFYQMNYPVAVAAWVSPLAHYVQVGQRTGFRPSLAWNEGKYLLRNRDVNAAVMSRSLGSGLEHYMGSGRFELNRLFLGDNNAVTVSQVTNVLPNNLAISDDEMLTILRSNTVSGNVEVERKVTTAGVRNRFQLLERAILPVSVTAATLSDFTMRGQDLAHVHVSGGRINFSIYTRASGFTTASEHYATPFGEAERTQIAFRFMDNGDLAGIKHKNTGTRSIEVHVLSRSSGYRTFVQQTGSRLRDQDVSEIRSIAVVGRDIMVVGKSAQNQPTVFRIDSRVGYQGAFEYSLRVAVSTLNAVQALTVPNGNTMLLSLDSFSLFGATNATNQLSQLR